MDLIRDIEDKEGLRSTCLRLKATKRIGRIPEIEQAEIRNLMHYIDLNANISFDKEGKTIQIETNVSNPQKLAQRFSGEYIIKLAITSRSYSNN